MKGNNSGILEVIKPAHRKSRNAENPGQLAFRDEEYFELLAENSRDVIFHTGMYPTHHFIYVSPSATRITGYTPEDFYANPTLPEKCIYPDDYHLISDKSQWQYFSNSSPVEIRWIRKDGKLIWTEHLINQIHKKNGKPDSYLIVMRDITERKAAEAALLESQKFATSLLENAPHATAVIDADTRIKYVNPAWEKLNGWTAAEVVGTKIPYPWWPKEEMPQFMDGFTRLMSTPTGRGELPSRNKNGELIWVDLTWNTVIRDGKFVNLVINSIEITDRKRIEDALKESESKYRSIFESSNDIILGTDIQGKIVDINGKVKEIAGYEKEEIIGRKFTDLIFLMPGKTMDLLVPIFNKRLAGESIAPYEIEMLKKNGESIYFELNAVPQKVNDKVIGDVVILRDITLQKRSLKVIQESEEKFSKAFRGSPNAVCIMSIRDSKFIETNDSFVRFTGYTREEIIGNNPTGLNLWVNDTDETKMAKVLQETGRLDNMEVKSRMKSGEVRTGLFSAEMIDIGEVKCAIIVITDITSEVNAKKALRESEEKFAAAFQASPDMMAIMSIRTNKYLEVNDSYTQCLGYSREELISQSSLELPLFASREEGIRMENMIKNGKVSHEEFRFRTKQGEERIWLCSVDNINISSEPCFLCVATDITERKQAQQALHESEERFSAAFHASPDMMIITDVAEAKFIDVNESFTINTGYSREELVGHSTNEIDLWADEKELEDFLKIIADKGKVKNAEYRRRRKDGGIRTWLCSSEMITIGGKVCAIAVASDITERKNAEKALKDSEEKFSKAFNASPLSISISHLGTGKLIEVNDGFLRDKGYTREEVIGRTSKELNLWMDEQTQVKFMNGLKEKGGVHNEMIQSRTKSGQIRTGLISAEIISIANESCVLTIYNDITQQKQAEEQLRLLGSVTQQVTDSTIVTDPRFKITYINEAAHKLFGYTLEEVRGKDLSILNDEPMTEELLNAMRDKIFKNEVWSGILTKKHKSGRSMVCENHLSPLCDENGRIYAYIVVQRDVTREKEVEAKLQEHKKLIDSILANTPEGVIVIDHNKHIILANNAIHDIFHLGKAALKNKELEDFFPAEQFFDLHNAINTAAGENKTLEFRYQVQNQEKIIYCIVVKMDRERTLLTFTDVSREREEEEKLYLTDRLASIGEMAAGIAHELNNPLTGILALSQMLVSSDIAEEHKEDLQCINSEAKRAANIVKNVLLFARNKPDITGRSNINEVIKDVLRLREYEERGNNIKVVTNLEENLANVSLDKGQLQQVFLNIISNAEAAIKEVDRPGLLTVTTQRVNNHVNISFTDNGCGISKQIMSRIFDPFFTTKEVGKGTGLGLSICYSIITKSGGKINVKSQVNEGTTFTIRLPVVSPEK
jgi:PAS domain S-box-containing protein